MLKHLRHHIATNCLIIKYCPIVIMIKFDLFKETKTIRHIVTVWIETIYVPPYSQLANAFHYYSPISSKAFHYYSLISSRTWQFALVVKGDTAYQITMFCLFYLYTCWHIQHIERERENNIYIENQNENKSSISLQ